MAKTDTTTSKITADGSRTRFSNRYQETYHSHFGAETESRLVFLEASGVRQRIISGQPTSVLELGFGLGLNFLLTADLALDLECHLAYVAFENDLIDAPSFLELEYADLLHNTHLINSLLPVFNPIEHADTTTTHLSHHCQLTLHSDDIAQADFSRYFAADLDNVAKSDGFDAIYLDAFSPETNPECWTLGLFQQLRNCLKPGGILATYSAKGVVRRALSEAGFAVEKLPGPPGKREILRAVATG